jgi:hypothetical protein
MLFFSALREVFTSYGTQDVETPSLFTAEGILFVRPLAQGVAEMFLLSLLSVIESPV